MAPVSNAVPYGNGYLVITEDAGVFTYSDEPFLGSFGGEVRAIPIVAGAAYTP